MTIDDPETYYDEHDEAEWDRLVGSLHGRLEWEGTVDYLDEFLPPSGRVLDVGGGAGRYTVWLAERGYDVTLVDPSDGQRRIAREKVEDRGLGDSVSVREGSLPELDVEPDRFDATLCLGGPLSHVLDADERLAAVRELDRVTAPGERVFASVMGRLNFVQILLADQHRLDLVTELAESGDYDAELLGDRESAFTETHFFRADEFEDLLGNGGLAVDRLAGLEGLASVYSSGQLRETTEELSDGDRESIRELVDRQREGRTVADVSAHVLAVCSAADE